MSSQRTKSFNGLVFEIASHRLNLKRREKIVFQRLLGFLIRNDKPFPYSRKALSQLTGYSHRSLDESLNCLEHLRLINRIGFTNLVKFYPGTILLKIFTLAHNRAKIIQAKKGTLAQKLREASQTSAETAYNKTSSSLKLKENVFSSYQEYVGRLKADINLGLIAPDVSILSYEQWINNH